MRFLSFFPLVMLIVLCRLSHSAQWGFDCVFVCKLCALAFYVDLLALDVASLFMLCCEYASRPGFDVHKQVSWKKIARPPSNPLLDVVTKLDEQVQSVTAPPNPNQKSSKMVDMAKMKRKKHYRLESEEKPQFPFQQKNFYPSIMENKEIVKTLASLSMCSANVKTVSILSKPLLTNRG